MGKSKQKKVPTDVLDLLQTVDPKQIPTELLEGIFVTLADKTKYQIDQNKLVNGIDYDEIVSHIKATGAKSNIDSVEIIIDIDYIFRLVNKQAQNLLDHHFAH